MPSINFIKFPLICSEWIIRSKSSNWLTAAAQGMKSSSKWRYLVNDKAILLLTSPVLANVYASSSNAARLPTWEQESWVVSDMCNDLQPILVIVIHLIKAGLLDVHNKRRIEVDSLEFRCRCWFWRFSPQWDSVVDSRLKGIWIIHRAQIKRNPPISVVSRSFWVGPKLLLIDA